MCNHKDHTWNSFGFCPHEQSGKKWNKFSFNFYILKQTQNPKLAGLKQYIVWSEMKDTDKWQCYDHFRPFFCHMYVHLSQNWGSDGHFEVLNWSKFWLVQKLWHKTQIFPFPFFCDFVQNQTFVFFAFLHFVS